MNSVISIWSKVTASQEQLRLKAIEGWPIGTRLFCNHRGQIYRNTLPSLNICTIPLPNKGVFLIYSILLFRVDSWPRDLILLIKQENNNKV